MPAQYRISAAEFPIIAGTVHYTMVFERYNTTTNTLAQGTSPLYHMAA